MRPILGIRSEKHFGRSSGYDIRSLLDPLDVFGDSLQDFESRTWSEPRGTLRSDRQTRNLCVINLPASRCPKAGSRLRLSDNVSFHETDKFRVQSGSVRVEQLWKARIVVLPHHLPCA